MGSSTSVPPNSISFMWFDSLSTWFISRFASVKTFTSTATFRFNPPAFPPNSRLKPPPNPGGSNDGSLLLLLFPKGGLLLSLSKDPNPPNGFILIVPKCRKYPPLVFSVPVALFYWLLSPAVTPVVPVSWLAKLNIFGIAVVF